MYVLIFSYIKSCDTAVDLINIASNPTDPCPQAVTAASCKNCRSHRKKFCNSFEW